MGRNHSRSPFLFVEGRFVKSLKLLVLTIALSMLLPFSVEASPSLHTNTVSLSHSLSGQCTYSYSEPHKAANVNQLTASLNMTCSVSHTRTVQICIIDPQGYWHCSNGNTSYGRYFNDSVYDSSITFTGGVYYWYAWVYMYDNSNSETWTAYTDGAWLNWTSFWV